MRRTFDLAIDHGVFRNAEFLAGIENLPEGVATAVRAGPDAIQLGVGQAPAIALNLFHAADKTELYRQCLANIAAVKAECERYGMPLMIEPLVLEPGARGNYESSGDCGRILTLVRQAVELGADLIKCDPPADAAEFNRLVEAAGGRPVLARGGGRMREEIVFERTLEILRQGASGIVYGRNIIQHPKPRQMTQVLIAVVHRGAGVDAGMAILRG